MLAAAFAGGAAASGRRISNLSGLRRNSRLGLPGAGSWFALQSQRGQSIVSGVAIQLHRVGATAFSVGWSARRRTRNWRRRNASPPSKFPSPPTCRHSGGLVNTRTCCRPFPAGPIWPSRCSLTWWGLLRTRFGLSAARVGEKSRAVEHRRHLRHLVALPRVICCGILSVSPAPILSMA